MELHPDQVGKRQGGTDAELRTECPPEPENLVVDLDEDALVVQLLPRHVLRDDLL